MAEFTKIEWATHTFNGWAGCEKISPACDNCYAERDQARYRFAEWGPDAPRRRTKDWSKPRRWNADQAKLEAAAAAAGLPAPMRPRVFAFSWADVFETGKGQNGVDLAKWRVEFFELVHETPHLWWLILTKRPANMAAYFARHGGVPANVLPGTTAETQAWLDRRARWMETMDAPWFLSVEPVLAPVTLAPAPRNLSWVIVGGESGPGARPMLTPWVRQVRDQAVAAGIPFHFKQWGEFVDEGCPHHAELGAPSALVDVASGAMTPGGVATPFQRPVWRVGRQAAGRMLDGRTWDELPALFGANP